MIFPWTVWCLRDHYGALSSGSVTTFPHVSLFTKGDDSAMTVPVWCCFCRTCVGPFRSIVATSFDRISPGCKHFVGSGFWPNCLSQCCVRHVSLTVPKPPDSYYSFHKSVVTSRASPSHFVSWFLGLDPPQAPTHNVEPGSPVKRLLFTGGVSLDALLYYQ